MESASAVAQVRARLAHCWAMAHPVAGDLRDESIGAFTLRADQRAAVQRIQQALSEHGGALLADPPGTGKTIVALAVAERYQDILVVAPAMLRDQWTDTTMRAGVTIRFVSMEALSRATPSALMHGCETQRATQRLLIVDEAHHARNRATRRYAHLAALCTGAHVLLLSATPVVNRARDRDALLGLFLGARAASLSAAEAARCVVRRTDEPAGKPAVRTLPQLAIVPMPQAAQVARALERLPPPFPAVDGAPALALVRITLAMAWASSLGALDAALRRRIQRGAALLDSLDAGRWPTRAALRQWIVNDESTQLAFPDLEPVAPDTPAHAAAMLNVHLAAVRELRALIKPCVAADTAARADALRALLRDNPTTRVVVFARSADTVRALWSVLRGEPAVVALVGDRVLAAQGRWRREEVLRAVGPRATTFRGDDLRGVRLLLTTDLLAEGVDLQGIGILVHADRAWTPARHEQREGRIARLGGRSVRREVLMTRFESPPESMPLLRLGARLMRKQYARGVAVRSAERMAATERMLSSWSRADLGRARYAVMTAPRPTSPCFLAAISHNDRIELLAGRQLTDSVGKSRWRVSNSPERLATVANRLAADGATILNAELIHEVRRALARFTTARAATEMIAASDETAARLTRRLRHRADASLRGTAIAARAGSASSLSSSFIALRAARGAGVERQLANLLARAPTGGSGTDLTFEADLQRLASGSISHDPYGEEHRMAGPWLARDRGARPRLLALLILAAAPAAPSPPSASP